jgi:hypothetical protein
MASKYPGVLTVSANPYDESLNLVTSYRWGWYGISFLIPFAGIFIGLFLYDQDSREVRKVGRNCLFIGFLIWVVFPILVLMAIFLVGALTLFSWIADALPSAD